MALDFAFDEPECWRCGALLGPGSLGNFCSLDCQQDRTPPEQQHEDGCTCFDCVHGQRLDRWLEGART